MVVAKTFGSFLGQRARSVSPEWMNLWRGTIRKIFNKSRLKPAQSSCHFFTEFSISKVKSECKKFVRLDRRKLRPDQNQFTSARTQRGRISELGVNRTDVSVRGNIGLAGVNYRTCRVAGEMSNLRLGVHVCRP